jgi:GDP-6-deoxy-D-talose 4-dehydrogenase
MKTVMVTGADGFTGRYMVKLLQSNGFNVIGLGLLTTDADETLICDITDEIAVAKAIAQIQPEWVVHLAAMSFVGHGEIDTIYQVNVVGTRNLFVGLAKLARPPKAVLIASSGNVYGNAAVQELTEDSPLLPANDYGISKLAMEHVARLWMDCLPIIITRPFNYTGIGQNKQFLIPKIVDHFARKECSIELGNINVEREFSDVRVVCQKYLLLLESAATSVGKTFNICSGTAYSLRQILSYMSQISGYEIEVKINPEFIRENEIKRLVGSNKNLLSVIGEREREHPHIRETLKWMYEGAVSKGFDLNGVGVN